MSVKAKYQKVLDLGEKLNVKDGRVEEGDGKLKVWGTVDCQYEKDQLWDAIKAIGGENPSDIMADIRVANTGYYAKHTVQKGDTLSKIAQHYYGDMKKYMAIFEANRDILKNPDLIHPGQVLTIPNL